MKPGQKAAAVMRPPARAAASGSQEGAMRTVRTALNSRPALASSAFGRGPNA